MVERRSGRRVSAHLGRIHDADDFEESRPWTSRRCETFHASNGGLWTITAAGTSGWERAPLEGCSASGVGEDVIRGEGEMRGCVREMKACVREVLSGGANAGKGKRWERALKSLASATLTPTLENSHPDEPSASSLERRLREARELLSVSFHLDERTVSRVIDESLEENCGLVKKYSNAVADIETQIMEDSQDKDALNFVLHGAVRQLKYLKGQSAHPRAAVRLSVGTLTHAPKAKSVNAAPARRKRSKGFFSCCTSEADEAVYQDDATDVPSESRMSTSQTNEPLVCHVRILQEEKVVDSFSIDSHTVSSEGVIFNAVSPLVFVQEDATIEITFHARFTSGDSPQKALVETHSRMQKAIGFPCVQMSPGAKIPPEAEVRGQYVMRISDLAETTRKSEPHSFKVSVVRPDASDAPKQQLGSAMIYIDKFIETFDGDLGSKETTNRDVLRDVADILGAIDRTRDERALKAIQEHAMIEGNGEAIVALAEMYFLCSKWRFETDFIDQLNLSVEKVATAAAVGRIRSRERVRFEELSALVARQLEYELFNILPGAKFADDELVDPLDMEEVAKIVPQAVSLYALVSGKISGTQFILRLKKIVRRRAQTRSSQLLRRECATQGPPSVESVTRMIEKTTRLFKLSAPILQSFPGESDVLSEDAVVCSSFLVDALRAVFDALAGLDHPPSFDAGMIALDDALTSYRKALGIQGLKFAMQILSPKFVDRLFQPALDETLAMARSKLTKWLRAELTVESAEPVPLDPALGVMHSASCANLFCILYNINESAKDRMLNGNRAVLNATALGRVSYQMLTTYVDKHEQSCLKAIKYARSVLMQRARGQTIHFVKANDVKPLLTPQFYTQLSNIHQCVVSMQPFMDEMPLLWCSSKLEFEDALQRELDPVKAMDSHVVEFVEYAHIDEDEHRASDDDFLGNRVMQNLRRARANVIASLTELIEERVAAFVRVAILDSDVKTREGAMTLIFAMLEAEFGLMDARLAPGVFRLAVTSLHKGVCDAIEQLILHRSMEEGEMGPKEENWRGSPQLNESQHSFAVELTMAVHEFLYCDGAGEPESVMRQGEGRLQRLLNLWFTPTVEVIREFWQLKETLCRSIVVAKGKQMRIRAVGGISVQDILRFLRQRSNMDVGAAQLFDEQGEAIMKLILRALFGQHFTEADNLAGVWVCRNDSGLMGRFFITETHLAFSTSGINIDHPHDSQTSIVGEIRHIANMVRIDAADGTPAIRIAFDDRRTFVFSSFCGVHETANHQARERDAVVSTIRMNPSFLKRTFQSHEVSTVQAVDYDSDSSDAEQHKQLDLKNLEMAMIPASEKIIASCEGAYVNGMSRIPSKLVVTEESCVFMPLKGSGRLVLLTDLEHARPQLQKFGWKNADIVIPVFQSHEPVIRMTNMRVETASTFYDALNDAIDARVSFRN